MGVAEEKGEEMTEGSLCFEQFSIKSIYRIFRIRGPD